MGQAIVVEPAVMGGVVIFTTDRSITGQDGVSYASADAAGADNRFPGALASRLYAAADSLSSVFVASNQVVVSRDGDWDDEAVDALARVISDFFLFYSDQS